MSSPLPTGWAEAVDPASGDTYYYREGDEQTVTWDRPGGHVAREMDPDSAGETAGPSSTASSSTSTTTSKPAGSMERAGTALGGGAERLGTAIGAAARRGGKKFTEKTSEGDVKLNGRVVAATAMTAKATGAGASALVQGFGMAVSGAKRGAGKVQETELYKKHCKKSPSSSSSSSSDPPSSTKKAAKAAKAGAKDLFKGGYALYKGIKKGTKETLSGAGDATVDVVSHRYGDNAGEATKNTLDVGYDVKTALKATTVIGTASLAAKGYEENKKRKAEEQEQKMEDVDATVA